MVRYYGIMHYSILIMNRGFKIGIGAFAAVLVLLGVFMMGSNNDAEREKSVFVDKGSRLLGIDVTMAHDNDYGAAFRVAKDAGAEFVTLSFAWDDIEISPLEYGNENLAIANSFYPGFDTGVVLVISPIDTNNIRVPIDLKDKSFDDPEVIARFRSLVDYIFSEIPDLTVVSLAIGNEIDLYLGKNKDAWREYETFFEAATAYIKSIRPDSKVGTKITLGGLVHENIHEGKSINQHSSVVMTTYYPLHGDFTVQDVGVVESDFASLVTLYANREVHILETGYPSGKVVKSSRSKQAEFIRAIFESWDAHAGTITAIAFSWLHDRSASELEFFKSYYRVDSEKFLDYLGTLGLREYSGKAKESFRALQEEVLERGWR
jgi:hypothetical protein